MYDKFQLTQQQCRPCWSCFSTCISLQDGLAEKLLDTFWIGHCQESLLFVIAKKELFLHIIEALTHISQRHYTQHHSTPGFRILNLTILNTAPYWICPTPIVMECWCGGWGIPVQQADFFPQCILTPHFITIVKQECDVWPCPWCAQHVMCAFSMPSQYGRMVGLWLGCVV